MNLEHIEIKFQYKLFIIHFHYLTLYRLSSLWTTGTQVKFAIQFEDGTKTKCGEHCV